MREDAVYAATLLAAAGPDVITYEATAAGFVLGVDGEAALVREIEDATGIRATTGAASVAASLEALGIKKVSVYAATPEEVTQYTVRYLTDKGFDVRRHESVSFSHASEGFRMSPWEVYAEILKFHRRCLTWRPSLLPEGASGRSKCWRPSRRTWDSLSWRRSGQHVALLEDSRGEGPCLWLWTIAGKTEVRRPAPATGR